MSEESIKPFRWNDQKNSQLQAERGVCFEDVVAAIAGGKALKIIKHPNQARYPSQRILIIEINQYIYLVPFVENDQETFLKTIIPSRKLKKQYLGE